jgi:parallel beta-helix repeat protein
MSTTVIQLDHRHFVGEPSIIIFKESDVVYALDARTKGIIASGSDASDVIQKAINYITSGKILIRHGTYEITKTIKINNSWIQIEGEVRGTCLKLAHGANCRLLEVSPPSGVAYLEYVTLKDLMFRGERAYQSEVWDAILFHGVHRGTLINVVIEDFNGIGLIIEGTDTQDVFENELINVHLGHNQIGLKLGNRTADNKVIGCHFYNNDYEGVYAYPSGANTFIGCHAFLNKDGIYLGGHDNRLIGSYFESNKYIGLRITSSRNVVIGCYAYNNEYGIAEQPPADFNIIIGCTTFNNTTANIYKVGTGTIVKSNYGYDTEKSGVATITANSTRVTVSHGLVSAPSKVLITPLGQPAGKLWVENITSTGFDIVTDTAPTTNLNIAWYAEV